MDRISSRKMPTKPHEWRLSFKNGLSVGLRPGAQGVRTFKVRSLRGSSRQKVKDMPYVKILPYSIECKNMVLLKHVLLWAVTTNILHSDTPC